MLEKIIIAGAGGQGIMLLGQVLAEVAIKENKHVTWLPAYGAEVRGGTAHCMVVISDQEIASPFIDRADTLIIMNGPSFTKFRNRIKNQGLFIINSSLVSQEKKKNAHILEYPFTDIALKLGNIRVANMVAVGCYLAKKKSMDINNVFKIIEEIAPEGKKDLIEINHQAVSFGRQLIKKQ